MGKKSARIIVFAISAALLVITLLGTMSFSIKGIEFSIDIGLYNHGQTEIHIPPVGSISAQTHLSPVKITINLENINIEVLQQLINNPPSSQELAAEISKELKNAALLYFSWLILLAVIGGAGGAVFASGKDIKAAILGAVAGFCICIVLLGLTLATYQAEKLRNPEYHGALKAAPWAIGLAENAFQKFDILGEQMQVIAVNLYKIFESIDKIDLEMLSQEDDDLLVLHVSDIHNNPAAHKFLLQIVKSFPVDLVIDTGDMTDYGTPVETQLLKGLMDLQIPYLFVPGNHDSPEVIKELSKYPQVQVLTGGTVDIQGLRILALADPSSESRQINPANQEIVEQYKKRLIQLWEEAEKKPDLVAVHNYLLAESLVGKVPLILYGHIHQCITAEENGTVMICPGSTGAEGIRGLQAANEAPYSVVLLHFKKDKSNNIYLNATDTIKLYSLEKGFILERKLFAGQGEK